MGLKITARRFLVSHYLVIKRDGVKFYESTIGFGVKRFKFHRIDCVLMSPENRLSFQVGNQVFSIPTDPRNPKHQAVVDALLDGVRRGHLAF